MANNDLQKITQKTKIEHQEPIYKNGMNLRAPEG